ncbi:hypothetical protein O9992_14180 [Vibrio lentus]|nr:hypothetical protein [Vibrio lentus]
MQKLLSLSFTCCIRTLDSLPSPLVTSEDASPSAELDLEALSASLTVVLLSLSSKPSALKDSKETF